MFLSLFPPNMVNTFLFLPTALSTPLSHRRTFSVAVKNNYLLTLLWLCITHDIAVFYSFLFFPQELIKNTDRNDEDRPDLEMALEAMQVRQGCLAG